MEIIKLINENDNFLSLEIEDRLLEGEQLEYAQEPGQEEWCLIPLYTTDAKGMERLWQIGFDPRTNELVTIHGCVSGEKQTTRRQVKLNTTGRNFQEQALIQARNNFWAKMHDGYHALSQPLETHFIQPMLAEEYKSPDSGRGTKLNFPVMVEVKFDGIRCLASQQEGEIRLSSRKNRPFRWLEKIRKEVEHFLKFLPQNSILDGELYTPELNFNQLVSAVRTVKTKHSDNDHLYYYIFDIIESDHLPFEKRYNLLISAMKLASENFKFEKLCLVPAILAYNHEEISELHTSAIAEGYEGLILRKLSNGRGSKQAIYRHCRTSNILKVKHFYEEEGIVIDVLEGQGTEKGLALFLLQDNQGQTFSVRPKGSFEQRAKWLKEKEKISGLRYTFQYFERTEYGLPRFPRGKAFRNYEE